MQQEGVKKFGIHVVRLSGRRRAELEWLRFVL